MLQNPIRPKTLPVILLHCAPNFRNQCAKRKFAILAGIIDVDPCEEMGLMPHNGIKEEIFSEFRDAYVYWPAQF